MRKLVEEADIPMFTVRGLEFLMGGGGQGGKHSIREVGGHLLY